MEKSPFPLQNLALDGELTCLELITIGSLLLHSPSNWIPDRTPKELTPLKLNKHIATTTATTTKLPPPIFQWCFFKIIPKHLEFALAQLQQLWHLIEFDPWESHPRPLKSSPGAQPGGNEQLTRLLGTCLEEMYEAVKMMWTWCSCIGILWIAFENVSNNPRDAGERLPVLPYLSRRQDFKNHPE